MGGSPSTPRSPLQSPLRWLQRSPTGRANAALPALLLEKALLEKELSILLGHIVFWHTYFQFRLCGFFDVVWRRALRFWMWGAVAGFLALVL